MPLFNSAKDIKLFNTINKELIDNIIDTTIIYLKLDAQKMHANVYGQTTKKIYKNPVRIAAMINNLQPTSALQTIGMINKERQIIVSFNNAMLRQANINPQVSDIVQYNNSDYQIYQVISNKYIGGQTTQKFSTICKCTLTTIANTVTQKPEFKHKEISIYE